MLNEAEWLTRKSRIDTRLKQNGWQLMRFAPGGKEDGVGGKEDGVVS